MQNIGDGRMGEPAAMAIRSVAEANGVTYPTSSASIVSSSSSSLTLTTMSALTSTTPLVVPSVTSSNAAAAAVTPSGGSVQFEAVFTSCPIGMAVADSGGSFLDCNQFFCKLTGYHQEQLRSFTLFNLIDPQDLQRAFDSFTSLLMTNKNDPFNPIILRGSVGHRGSNLCLRITLVGGPGGGDINRWLCITLLKPPSSASRLEGAQLPAWIEPARNNGSERSTQTDLSSWPNTADIRPPPLTKDLNDDDKDCGPDISLDPLPFSAVG